MMPPPNARVIIGGEARARAQLYCTPSLDWIVARSGRRWEEREREREREVDGWLRMVGGMRVKTKIETSSRARGDLCTRETGVGFPGVSLDSPLRFIGR